jgi:hypothetical protein
VNSLSSFFLQMDISTRAGLLTRGDYKLYLTTWSIASKKCSKRVRKHEMVQDEAGNGDGAKGSKLGRYPLLQ